ncbi:hypothetical protein [Sporosarcina sp. FSL K6-3457]|uniref:hypothetical protein n=1 Tax=Sporosarcina sp. FSL K6-3457 TaxID=2978204 RepID=UPI0030F7DF37
MSDIETILTIVATLLAAIFGALISVIGTNNKDAKNQRQYEKQVEKITKESCQRVLAYLQAMEKEDFDESSVNLKYRIAGIKVIEKLLSDFSLDKIIGDQIYVVYRVREQINDLICDLENANDNYFNTRQYIANLEFQLGTVSNESEGGYLKNEIEKNLEGLENNYNIDTRKQIKENIELFSCFIRDYDVISSEISKNNQSL